MICHITKKGQISFLKKQQVEAQITNSINLETQMIKMEVINNHNSNTSNLKELHKVEEAQTPLCQRSERELMHTSILSSEVSKIQSQKP